MGICLVRGLHNLGPKPFLVFFSDDWVYHSGVFEGRSYLKIQAVRWDAALRSRPAPGAVDGAGGGADPSAILAEMRTGISSAYRQLRELLTTFRLKMDGAGLGSALAGTAQEFETRGGLRLRLRDRLPPGLLTANEEVHVLQIVREALSNVVRHAGARTCRALLMADAGCVRVAVSDDGIGYARADTPSSAAGDATADPAPLHHGTTIMRERARSLDGELTVAPRAGGGTRVVLCFCPRALRVMAADAESERLSMHDATAALRPPAASAGRRESAPSRGPA
jgi:two-component system nitrate/nitrite sensor histidine kinase NarX